MPQEVVSVSIDKELVHRIDGQVDDGKYRNRSHAFEILLNKGLGKVTP